MKHFSSKYQSGFTMVELMVSLVLSVLIAMAAIAALVASRQGLSTVDAASELRDNARFAADIIQRIAVQGGFKDVLYATQTPTAADTAANYPANVTGFNNSKLDLTDATASTTIAWQSGQVGLGSDVLVLRYQAAQLNEGAGATTSDGSVIDCAGNPAGAAPTNRGDRELSIFYVDADPNGSGEPALMCASLDPTAATPTLKATALISGVENFQVTYGIDAVNPVANQVFTGTQDSVPKAYMRADQMVVGTVTSASTYNNWRRVRSIRIGMVMRGAVNTLPGAVSQTFYPLGLTPLTSTSPLGTGFSGTADVGTVFTPAVDNRLRQVATFTVHLRNDQGL
jgi:type IV pilus assembly protein PilW